MNLKNFLLFTLGLLYASTLFPQQWDYTNIPATGRYDDIYFNSADTGWAVNSQGEIFSTMDGGNTWTLLYHNPDLYLRSVEFLNDKVGFVGSLSRTFLKTVDGGETWTEIQSLIPGLMTGICGLSHSGNTIYGVGVYAYPAYFIKSTDQGESWTLTDLSDFADGLVECQFLDSNVGFVSGIKENSGGVILKTTDGGDNWSVVLNTESGSESIWKLDFVTDQIAYGSIEAYTNIPARIVKTMDGGDHWTIHEVNSEYINLQGIGFINQYTGWVAPRRESLYETRDGGETWTKTNLYPNINRFFRISSDLMYASGSLVYKYDDISVSTQQIPSYDYFHSITEIAPNPFTNDLRFSIRIDRETRARLDLFSSTAPSE